jgi:putative Mg2+ transporter-C (MgtC) family protein
MRDLPAWMGDIHATLPAWYCGIIVTTVSVLCGALVGMERGKRQKPAGLRTMMLICLGACIFTQAGMLIAGHSDDDAARVAAQVVSGVGFLGAGSIIQSRGMITGFTTAAAIWVVAAIGVAIGAGYVVAGAFFTLLTLLTLAAERTIESLVYGRCVWTTVRIEFDANDGKARPLIQEILDDYQVGAEHATFCVEGDGRESVSIRYCHRHRSHRAFLADLAKLPVVGRIGEPPRAEKRAERA